MNLTKEQAITAMRVGAKVTHSTFTDNEWMTMKGVQIKFEDGCVVSGMMFWLDRTSESWNDGYSLVIDKETAESLWSLLGDTPINEEEEIDIDFLTFEKGTDRETIWTWFEETFNLSVAEDLMFQN
jgi:hypothetical protein